MAVTTIQKLLRRPPSWLFSSLQSPLLHSQNPTPLLQEPKSSESHIISFKPFIGSLKPENPTHVDFARFHPISLVGFVQYPVLTNVPVSDGEKNDDSGMYADSVKKKRKKKMNKHKYKKLRKRMRRQS